MAGLTYLLRFFIVAPPVPRLMIVTFVVVVALGSAVVILDPARGAAAATPIVVLQLFAAASGFAVAARRGHYDLVLTRGAGRLRVGLAHWATSIAPGTAGWLTLGLIEALRSGADSHVFASGTCAAMVLVSTLPWALSVRLPRFSASVGWLLVLVTAATMASPQQLLEWERPSALGWARAYAAARFLIYPLGSVGAHMDAAGWFAAIPGITVAVCAMCVALRWVVSADFPLEAGQ